MNQNVNSIINSIKNNYQTCINLYEKLKNGPSKTYIDTRDDQKHLNIEHCFIGVLNPIISKPSFALLPINHISDLKDELLDSMYHLGNIVLYSQTNEDYRHVKAAAIFQYCANFSSIYHTKQTNTFFWQKAQKMEKTYLESEGIISNTDYDMKNYKEELKEFRKKIEKNIEDENIDQFLSKKTNNIEDTYNKIDYFFTENEKGFLVRIINDCYKQLNITKEKHAVIGLGSLSMGTMTPWSDLDFAMLISNESKQKKFLQFTQLLNIKIINLGETPIHRVGIQIFNDYKSCEPIKDWFHDNITPFGLSFDGAHDQACKTPYGRKGSITCNKNVDSNGRTIYQAIPQSDYDLILTPSKMVEFQKFDKKDTHHLSQALRHINFISGNEALVREYQEKVRKNDNDWQKTDEESKKNIFKHTLKQDLEKFIPKLTIDNNAGKILDVKQNIYRLPERIIVALKDYLNIDEDTTNIWSILLSMKKNLSEDGYNNLYTALSFASELRLKTYIYHDDKNEKISIDPLDKDNSVKQISKMFDIHDMDKVYNFFYIMSGLKNVINTFGDDIQESIGKLKQSDIFDDSYNVQAMLYAKFLEYDKAYQSFLQYQKEHPHKFSESYGDFQILCYLMGKYDESVEAGKKVLEIQNMTQQLDFTYTGQIMHNLCATYLQKGEFNIAENHCKKALLLQEQSQSYKNPAIYDLLGTLYYKLALYPKAEFYFHKALEEKQIYYEWNSCDIATSYNHLGNFYLKLGYYGKSLEVLAKELKINKELYVSNHSIIANNHHNIGVSYHKLGNYNLAKIHYEKELEIKSKLYEYDFNHPDIAEYYNVRGSLNYDFSQYQDALSDFKKALDIYHIIYSTTPNHPDIARQNNLIGTVYHRYGDYSEARSYYFTALAIRKIMYEMNPNHPEIATSYNNVGKTYEQEGNYDKAICYYFSALEIDIKAYGNIPNDNIAIDYNSLGTIYQRKQNYEKAVYYYQKALAMRIEIYEDNLNHQDIVTSYNKLGTVYSRQGNYDKSICHHLESLAIHKKIYPNNTPHEMAISYSDLGVAYFYKDNSDKAICYYLEALNIQKKIYPNISNQPDVIRSYENLHYGYIKKGYYDKAACYAQKILDARRINQPVELTIEKKFTKIKIRADQLDCEAITSHDIHEGNCKVTLANNDQTFCNALINQKIDIEINQEEDRDQYDCSSLIDKKPNDILSWFNWPAIMVTSLATIASLISCYTLYKKFNTNTNNDGDNAYEIVPVHPIGIGLSSEQPIAIIDLKNSSTYFNYNNDHIFYKTSWVGPNDAILFYDYNHTQQIDDTSKIILTKWSKNARTDFEALLEAFDDNKDYIFNKEDKYYKDFYLWQDANSNGYVEEGELKSLEERGIKAIDFTTIQAVENEKELIEQSILNTANVVWNNGSETIAYDLVFYYEV